jgi:hypothetical protein
LLSTSLLTLISATALAELPDLIINRSRLVSSVEIQERTFSASDCAVVEQCIKASGTRRLLLFEVAFVNIGKGDLKIGNPQNRPDLFEFSACHGHQHLTSAASYQLLTSDGRSVNAARKQAFCLRDNSPYSTSSGPSHGYDCDNQGLTAGWEDIYPKSLDCQWLDVTDLPGGTYTLRITVNPSHVFVESNYGNNSASVSVQLPPKASASPPVTSNPTPTGTPKVTTAPKKPAPKYVKKPKSNKGKHKGWYKKAKKKPLPKAIFGGKEDDD